MTTLFRRQSQRRYDRGHFVIERRKNWILPVIAALLALLLMWKDGRADERELKRGVTATGSAYWCYPGRALPRAILEWCVLLTRERR